MSASLHLVRGGDGGTVIEKQGRKAGSLRSLASGPLLRLGEYLSIFTFFPIICDRESGRNSPDKMKQFDSSQTRNDGSL